MANAVSTNLAQGTPAQVTPASGGLMTSNVAVKRLGGLMSNLQGISRLKFGGEETEIVVDMILRNRDVIEAAWPEIQHCLTPATVSQIDEHLSWLDEFLVQEAGKRERTDEQHKKYMLGWAAVLKTTPSDITAWAFGQWLERDTAFYPTPGQIKALAKDKTAQRRVLHYRAETAYNYLREHPDATPFVDGPDAQAMREKLANLSSDVAKTQRTPRLESQASKRERHEDTRNALGDEIRGKSLREGVR